MRDGRRGLGDLLVRSLAAAALAYAAVIVYLVSATLLTEESAGRPAAQYLRALDAAPPGAVWRPAYAARFPGCVDMARWAGPGVPATVVVLRRDGALHETSFDEAFERATGDRRPHGGRIIGACR